MPAMVIPAQAIARQGFRTYFERLQRRASDLGRVWDHVRRIIWDSEAALFRKEGALEEFPHWAPLTSKYAAWKRKHFGKRGILVLSGKLRGQLTGRRKGWFEDRQPQQFTLGTDYPVGDGYDLGGIHAKGRKHPRMASRKPLRIPWIVQERIADRITDYVTNADNEWESMAGARRRPRMVRYQY